MVEGTPTGFEPTGHNDSSIENIREYIDARIAEADRRYQMRYDFTDKALSTAQSTNNTRLDAMNEFRATLADQAARLPTRSEVEVMVSAARADAITQMAPLQVKVEDMAKPNITLMAAMFGILISVVSAAWVIIGLKIDATNLPVQVAIQASKTDVSQLDSRMSAVEAMTNSSSQADAQSRNDRDQLNGRMKTAEALITQSSQADSLSRSDRAQLNTRLVTLEEISRQNTSDLHAIIASTSAKLVEVETQFKLLSDILNLDKDQDQRLFTLLWKKAYPGQELPPLPFRPQMFKG
jgi:hypothetical protein